MFAFFGVIPSTSTFWSQPSPPPAIQMPVCYWTFQNMVKNKTGENLVLSFPGPGENIVIFENLVQHRPCWWNLNVITPKLLVYS